MQGSGRIARLGRRLDRRTGAWLRVVAVGGTALRQADRASGGTSP